MLYGRLDLYRDYRIQYYTPKALPRQLRIDFET